MKHTDNHKLTVVYGGQWGSEGKGQVAAHIAVEDAQSLILSVRVGGPNAGHTITGADGKVRKVQQVPVAGFVRQDSRLYIGASGFVLLDVLERELAWLAETWGGPLKAPPLIIDHKAILITEAHMKAERSLKKDIGSTGEGVGAATADKVWRKPDITIEAQWEKDPAIGDLFDRYGVVMGNVQEELTHMLSAGWAQKRHLIVEGTQGYMLSLNTSGGYPYVTSRDCGPEALMGQIGLSFRAFDPKNTSVLCTLRTFPIRVGGNSGPLPNEVTWEDMKRLTDGYVKTPETTTVTGKNRRIARLDWMTTYRMLHQTRPTGIAFTFLDYEYPGDAGVTSWFDLSEECRSFVRRMAYDLQTPILYVSTGPNATIAVPTEHVNHNRQDGKVEEAVVHDEPTPIEADFDNVAEPVTKSLADRPTTEA